LLCLDRWRWNGAVLLHIYMYLFQMKAPTHTLI
jgi:hypothetical protein